jgi:hypothetical protein
MGFTALRPVDEQLGGGAEKKALAEDRAPPVIKGERP